ncbi:MAG: M24 family metallopeptidase [Burkholderiales bacterium]
MLFNAPRARRLMAGERLDALVATSPDNVTYASGYWAMSHWARPGGPQVYAVIPADGGASPCLVTGSGNLDLVVEGEAWVTEAYRYGFFATKTDGPDLSALDARYAALLAGPDHGDAASALVAALRDRKLDRGRLAIEDTGMQPAILERVRRELPEAEIVSGARVFREIRTIKTPEEIERLRGAVRVTERGIEAALRVARPGLPERELIAEFDRTVITEGGVPVTSMCVGSGPRSALSNCQAGERRLATNEVVRFDGGVRFRWYRSDIARIAALGDPGERVRRYYGALRAGAERAIEAIRPGVRCAEIFRIAMETVRREGIPHFERSHVGHGIGINNYDAPDLAPKSDEVVEEGMVLCVETPYYELGWAGLQLENTVVVRAHGAEPLTSLGNELRQV